MRKPLSLLAASTALSAAIGFPGWSAEPTLMEPGLMEPGLMEPGVMAPGVMEPGVMAPGGTPVLAMPGNAAQADLLVLASGDDDDDDDDDDHHDDEDDEDECDDDDDGCGRRRPDPAPAGTVAPPANGLFGTGAPPQVKVN